MGIPGIKETITWKLKSWENESGEVDVKAEGHQESFCEGGIVSKSGQTLSITKPGTGDSCDDSTSSKGEASYCSDQDEIHFKGGQGPLTVTATLKKVACAFDVVA